MYAMSTRIRQCRSATRLSQAQLAARIGVRRSAVAQWEQPDGTSPSVAHLARLAEVTGACFEWLATGRGPAQLDAGALQQAVATHDFAKDEMENRILDSMRRLSRRNRLMACRIVELLADSQVGALPGNALPSMPMPR